MSSTPDPFDGTSNRVYKITQRTPVAKGLPPERTIFSLCMAETMCQKELPTIAENARIVAHGIGSARIRVWLTNRSVAGSSTSLRRVCG